MPLRLNPFEFRAGIYLTTSRLPRQCAGLNPFEFRAGIYLAQWSGGADGEVLIPLNSGLVFTCHINLKDARFLLS